MLELVKNQQFLKAKISPNILQNLFKFTINTTLNNLESVNNNPACFPLATVILDIFLKISELENYR